MASCWLAFLGATELTQAQALVDQFNKSGELLGASKWAEAENILQKIIREFGKEFDEPENPDRAKFGVVFFRLGFAQFNLGKFEEAAKSFQTCNQKYANKDGAVGNDMETLAIWWWGRSLLEQSLFSESLAKFEEYLKVRPAEEANVQQLEVLVNVLLCHLSLGNVEPSERGIVSLYDFVDRQGGLTPSNEGFFTEKFVSLVVAKSDFDRLDGFLEEWGWRMQASPYVFYAYFPQYLGHAAKAFEAKRYDIALDLFALFPTTEEVQRYIELRSLVVLESSPEAKVMAQVLQGIEEQANRKEPLDFFVAQGMTNLSRVKENHRAVYASAGRLLEQFPENAREPELLFDAASGASFAGDPLQAEAYGNQLLQKFPDHELAEQVYSFLLDALFNAGDYEQSLAVAERYLALPEAKESPERYEMALYVQGGALFYLARTSQAREKLREFTDDYPESALLEPSLNLLALSLIDLQQKDSAISVLQTYLEKFPEGAALAQVLFSRARYHFLDKEYEEAQSLLARLESERPGSPLELDATLLLGNIQEDLRNLEEAESLYRESIEMAESEGREDVVGEVYFSLIGLLETHGNRQDEILGLYETFREKHPFDAYVPEVATAAIEPLAALDRVDELLPWLSEAILATGGEGGELFELLVSVYVEVAREVGLKVEKIEGQLLGLARKSSSDALKADLYMSVVQLYQGLLRETKLPTEQSRFGAKIEALFEIIQRDFDVERLSDLILVRLADFLATAGNQAVASQYYDTVLERGAEGYRATATMGKARALARSGKKEEREQAMAMFQKLIQEGGREFAEDASRELILLYQRTNQLQKVIDLGLAHLGAEKRWRQYEAEVNYLVGKAYDDLGQWQPALQTFNNVWTVFTTNIEFSGPAWLRSAQLAYENLEKQKGYDVLWQMVAKLDTERNRRVDQSGSIANAAVLLQEWELQGGVVARPLPNREEEE